jgi:hypothetical protein
VAESKVLDWAKDVMARDAKPRFKATQRGKVADPGETLDALEERRARVLQMFEDGDIDRTEKKRRLAAIDAQMPALELGRRGVSMLSQMVAQHEGIDWDGDPAEVNAQLRNLWHHIELDPATMEPVRAIWTVGEEPWDVATREAYEARA